MRINEFLSRKINEYSFIIYNIISSPSSFSFLVENHTNERQKCMKAL